MEVITFIAIEGYACNLSLLRAVDMFSGHFFAGHATIIRSSCGRNDPVWTPGWTNPLFSKGRVSALSASTFAKQL